MQELVVGDVIRLVFLYHVLRPTDNVLLGTSMSTKNYCHTNALPRLTPCLILIYTRTRDEHNASPLVVSKVLRQSHDRFGCSPNVVPSPNAGRYAIPTKRCVYQGNWAYALGGGRHRIGIAERFCIIAKTSMSCHMLESHHSSVPMSGKHPKMLGE